MLEGASKHRKTRPIAVAWAGSETGFRGMYQAVYRRNSDANPFSNNNLTNTGLKIT
jgi:hypothetical protein